MVRGYLLSLMRGRQGLAGVRRACTAAMALLAIQLCVGTIVNLYVTIPAADSTVSFLREVKTAPGWLTLHALVGLALLAAGAMVMIRAIGAKSRALIGLAAAGLLALLGAFAAGEAFVRDGRDSVSLWMALLASLALLCYVAVQAIAAAERKDRKDALVEARPGVPAQRSGPGAIRHRKRTGSSAEG